MEIFADLVNEINCIYDTEIERREPDSKSNVSNKNLRITVLRSHKIFIFLHFTIKYLMKGIEYYYLLVKYLGLIYDATQGRKR